MRGITVGIDIGTTTTTTVVTERGKDRRLRILGVGSAPSAGMRRGAIADTEEAAVALRRSVADAEAASGVAVKRALISVSGAHLGAFPARGVVVVSRADGEITEADVDRVLHVASGFAPRSSNREVIHLIPRAYKVDGDSGILHPVGMVGMKLEVDAIAIDGAKSALQNIVKACDLAGIEIEDWVVGVLAASESILTKHQRELGVILLDLGAGTTDYAVFEEGRLIDAGSFPIGGSHITSDIAIGLRAPVAAAEAIKLRYTDLVPTGRTSRRETIQLAAFIPGENTVFAVRDLTEIVTARLTDIFELTAKALKRIGRAGLLPGGAVLIGGVAHIPGLAEFTRREIRLPVEVVRSVNVPGEEEPLPAHLAVPIGLRLFVERYGGSFSAGRKKSRLASFFEPLVRIFRAFVP